MSSGGTWIEQFPGNLTWSNAALVTKGMAPYGAVALGEIDEVCERLKARQGEADAWREEWCAMARRLERAADAAAATGSARSYPGRSRRPALQSWRTGYVFRFARWPGTRLHEQYR